MRISIKSASFLLLIQFSLNHSRVICQESPGAMRFSSSDAIYTTYAAPMGRTDYRTDQAYELMWMDPGKPVGMQSKEGGESGLMFAKGKQVRTRSDEFSSGPTILLSYSDIVRLTYYPFNDIKVDASFCVYSSNACIMEYTISNRSGNGISMVLYPYYSRKQGIRNARFSGDRFFSFTHTIQQDGWMKEHNIPLSEHYFNEFLFSENPDSYSISDSLPSLSQISRGRLNELNDAEYANVLVFQKNIVLQAGEQQKFRVIRYSNDSSRLNPTSMKPEQLLSVDLSAVIREDEKAYAKIPQLQSLNTLPEAVRKDRAGLYYSAFSLLRQCMMPAEGECSFNYYVFSREPRWGWGYGGQVFHESLSMLAYVYMDPQGAMNSQRVFMERQQKDGYVNYRTGPYLNETIETNSMKTSSAPWLSYINMEIFKVTNDKAFLKQAYESGRKLFEWYIRNRDKDQDGLYEWGGDATLECVRDGLVSVWDNVSKPENLEGPDLNSMLVMEAISLSMMAKELSFQSDVSYWLGRAMKIAGKINHQLWDPETGFYYNTLLSTNGFTFLSPNDLKIKEIIGFLPMWANLCSQDQAKSLVQSLSNPEEFWRPHGVPTLSARDNYYNPMGYWNGPVWIQWQYLLFRGLIDYGYYQLALQLGEKVIDQMTWHLRNDHTFWEFYSPDDRQAGWNKTYIWAGIVARMMIDMEKMKEQRSK